MADRLVVLKGPFTNDDLRQIVVLMQHLESERPEEEFHVAIDAGNDPDAIGLLAEINPMRQGYGRVVKHFPRRGPDESN